MRSLASRSISLACLSFVVVVGCGGAVEEPSDPEGPLGENAQEIIGTQRSAAAYSEAVMIKVNNAYGDFCTGVVIAPRVVLTAAHCIVFNRGGTWTITAPFASGGAQTRTAKSGEPMDAAFWNVDYWSYESHTELHDLGLVYLDTAFTGIVYPTLRSTRYPQSTSTSPVYVSAIGRKYVDASASLVRSARIQLRWATASDGYTLDYKTTRVTDGGDSGGPLFIEGTHQLVGTEALFDPSRNLDYWARLDGAVYTWLDGRVKAAGGWR